MTYASVDANGMIVQTSSLPAGIAGLIDVAMPDGIKDDTHYYDAGSSSFLAIPGQPSPSHTFDWVTHQWADPRSLTERMDAKWEEIKAARIEWFNAPLETPFGLFDCDGESRAYIQSAVAYLQGLAAIGEPGTVDFTLYDESVVTLDLEQMLAVGLALGARIQAGFNMAASLRVQIYSAPTIEYLESLHWD